MVVSGDTYFAVDQLAELARGSTQVFPVSQSAPNSLAVAANAVQGDDQQMADSDGVAGQLSANLGQQTVKLTKVQVLFNHNQLMTEGFGNTRKQAERNASINGLRWLKENKLLGEDMAGSFGVAVPHTNGDFEQIMERGPMLGLAQDAQDDGEDVEMTVEDGFSDNDEEERKMY